MKKPIVFGKYLLLERVNVGGMAEVFIAKAFGVEGFERILAIKKILPTMAEDQEFIAMFIDEARISVQLNHTNVVHIHELGKHNGAFYIAMEYVAGRDLRTLLERYRKRKETMPTGQAVYLAAKICEGLDYAHRKKDARGQELRIIHRDVSPQNILVSYEGEVKIIDFGIAKAANRSQKTQAGILKGKFGYMSPEQVRGMPIDRRSDIFALGVILYEMLTGEKLFVGESDFSTLDKVRNAEVPLPSLYNPNLPSALERVVLKALAREPSERYQWASDLQEDLLKFLHADESLYSAKQLQTFMCEQFAEELLREEEKMERFAAISRPDEIEASGLLVTGEPSSDTRRLRPSVGQAATNPGLHDGTEKTIIVAQSETSEIVAKTSPSLVAPSPPSYSDSEVSLPFLSGASDLNPMAKPRVVIGAAPEYTGQTIIGDKVRQKPVVEDEDEPDGDAQLHLSTQLLSTSREPVPTPSKTRKPTAELKPKLVPDPEPTVIHSPQVAGNDRNIEDTASDKPVDRRPRMVIAVAIGAVVLTLLGIALAQYLNPVTAGILVEVSPADSSTRVVVGGLEAPNPNAVTALEPGTYEVVASAPGHLAQRRTVNVARGQTAYVKIALEPIRKPSPPPVIPPSVPSGQAVSTTVVDRPPRISTAHESSPVVSRRSTVSESGALRRKAKGVSGASPAVPGSSMGSSVSAPAVLSVPEVRTRGNGKLACSSNPAGAEVWVNGKPTGRQTPVALANPLILPAGNHEVLFKLAGKQSSPMKIEIRENELTKLLNVVVD